MKPLARKACACGRGFAVWLCKRIGHPDAWCCDLCHAAWVTKLHDDIEARQ